MPTHDGRVTCFWLTPTRILPHPFSFDAGARPWSCLRASCPRPLSGDQLDQCAACPRWEPRTFDAARRDLAFETWGVGIDLPERTFDDARRDIAWETFGIDLH